MVRQMASSGRLRAEGLVTESTAWSKKRNWREWCLEGGDRKHPEPPIKKQKSPLRHVPTGGFGPELKKHANLTREKMAGKGKNKSSPGEAGRKQKWVVKNKRSPSTSPSRAPSRSGGTSTKNEKVANLGTRGDTRLSPPRKKRSPPKLPITAAVQDVPLRSKSQKASRSPPNDMTKKVNAKYKQNRTNFQQSSGRDRSSSRSKKYPGAHVQNRSKDSERSKASRG